MAEIFRKSLAMPIAFEMLSVNEWTQHLLCAERYGEGRVFIAGDAAHLVIPTGGLGMNTGVGDAMDLSWKLAATLAGWGGPELLASYEAERSPIGLRNVRASRAAMTGRLGWRAAYNQYHEKTRPKAQPPGRNGSGSSISEQRKVTEISGIEAGYRYVDSPIICRRLAKAPIRTILLCPHDLVRCTPSARMAGRRRGFTRSPWPRLHAASAGRDSCRYFSLERSFREMRAPLDVHRIAGERPREIYQYDLLLVRPDLHVVWRGNELPRDAAKIARVATGRLPSRL